MSAANRTAGGWALIAVGLLNVLVFLIHPTRGDQAPLVGPWGINAITHTLGVGLMPVMLLGCWALADWLGLDRPLVRLALCCNLLAIMLVCIAGLTSGWVTPAGFELSQEAGRMGVALNRACDRGYVAFMGIAMFCNGLAFPSRWRALKLFSPFVGLIPLAWVLSGYFNPHVHAMLLLSAGQVIWWIAAGRTLLVQPDGQ